MKENVIYDLMVTIIYVYVINPRYLMPCSEYIAFYTAYIRYIDAIYMQIKGEKI